MSAFSMKNHLSFVYYWEWVVWEELVA